MIIHTIKIADLGLSKQLAEMSHGINEIKGVPYIDPQAFKNNEYKLDKKSDVYSVGVLLWEISSERPPFEKSTNKVFTMLSIVTGNREQPPQPPQPISPTPSDKITSSSSSYINDFSVSISDELEEIKKMADDKINNKENNNTQGSKEDNEKIIISEDEIFLNILVTIFVNSINNGDEYYQTAISLFCFIEENNKDPTDI
ncbi:hypothetical protein RirG_190500 [Rhizophagus irregularis DAOM 197198w]|uniref:Protein kinase domain-containing protein n=1 Tax=Rhizophagus irregularis (strain DAOM 197198w) TaxID=1432141 RepID=A0A015JW08_RHIIW|nr:hypothetical protein RirG_190500 [Rhizophagus irregularis DAOM 197198w]